MGILLKVAWREENEREVLLLWSENEIEQRGTDVSIKQSKNIWQESRRLSGKMIVSLKTWIGENG